MNSVNPATITLAQIVAAVSARLASGPSFVGVTYTAKESGEKSRFVLNLGTDYLNLVRKSLAQAEAVETKTELEAQAKADVVASLKNTLANAEKGLSNDNYTKAGVYEPICKGIKAHKEDESFEVCGLVVSRKVLIAGVHKPVNSKPLTLAKNAIRKALAISKYRTLCLDRGHLESLRLGATEIEVEA
jgi:hypothetical protein